MVCPELSKRIRRQKGWSETDERLWGMVAGFILLILLTVNLALYIRIYLEDHSKKDNDTFSDIICELRIDPVNKTILREVREVKTGAEHWLDHPDPPHSYANNMWWRLINHTARINGLSDCYVCAQLPHSITGGDWWPYQDPDPEVMKNLTTIAVAAADMPDEDDLWIAEEEGEWTTVRTVKRVAGRVATVKDTPRNLTCYRSSEGQDYLGNIPSSHCSEIYNINSTNDETRSMCMGCLRNNTFPMKYIPQSMVSRDYLTHFHAPERRRCHKACNTTHIPDEEGTGVLEDWYWLCGHVVYTSLPRDWMGTCAMVELYGGTLVVKTPEHLHNHTEHQLTRPKRETERKVSTLKDRAKQSSWARDNYVPREHRLWTGTEKFFHAVIPALGVSLLQIEVEITRYELISFMNTTKVMMEGIQEELRGLRLTALQNRLVLDQLTASSGGVCVIVGSACCTYIPDNDADGHMIDEGIKNITNAIERMTAREVNANDDWGWNWFKGLWQKAEHIGLIAISALTMIIFLLCMWPCMMGMMRRAVNSSMKSSAVHQMVMYNVLCENNVNISDESNELQKYDSCSSSTEEE